MNELEVIRTPEIIGAEIRSLTDQARVMALRYGIEIGRRLVEAKELVEHGQWMNFLQEQTEFSTSAASRFMQLYKAYGADQGNLFGAESKFPTLGNLSISNALRLLAIPEEERESFAIDNDIEHKSAREVEELIKQKQELEEKLKEREREWEEAGAGAALEIIELTEKVEKAEGEFATASVQLATAREKIRELENRPIEVAVERDEEAIKAAAQEAANAAKAEADKQAKDFKKQLKDAAKDKAALKAELEDKLKSSAAALEKSQEALKKLQAEAQDSAAAMAEVKELRAKLSMAAPEVAVFKAAFDRVQREFESMLGALAGVDDETAEKLKTAARAVLKQFEGRLG